MSVWQLSRRLLQVARPVIAPLGISMLARLAQLLVGIAMFGLAGWQIAATAAGEVALSLPATLWWLVGLALAKALLRYLEQFAGHWVAFRSLALLRGYFFTSLEPQAPALTEAMDSGDLLSRVTKDVDRVEVFFAHTLAPLTTAVLVPVAVLTHLGMSTSWWVALTLLPFLVLAGAVVPALGGRASEAAAVRIRRARGALSHQVTDSVQGVREVLAFGAQQRRLDQMASHEEQIGAGLRTAGGWVAARRGLNQALLGGAVVAMTGVAGHLWLAGELSAGQLGMAVGVALAAFAPVLAVEDFAVDLDQAWASARRIFEVTDRAPLVAQPDSPLELATGGAVGVRVRGVDFTHPALREALTAPAPTGSGDDVPPAAPSTGPGAAPAAQRPQVLHGVDLDIPAGKVTAIVGASGSGKSTLASLLTRTWDTDAGSVELVGANGQAVDVRRLDLARLREVVAYAPQRPHVFNMSVRENLRLAAPGASEEAVAAACSAAALDEWLATEPAGLDTKVGEMGERVSGGQRQRLALARTLLRAAPVTVLDEATSQLDAATEARVLDGITRATRGRTLVVIAHRISTVRYADQIVVMDRGRVVEVGRWDELIAKPDGALAALAARESAATGA
ncbi:ABC transporter ATP-binding protein [Buchananella felis]|uniref:amino acid ABC transporter ATP-binding/permease protein n=1 Tax=Buchananella felis TaxID=3231492 RepID=UPI0035288871